MIIKEHPNIINSIRSERGEEKRDVSKIIKEHTNIINSMRSERGEVKGEERNGMFQ